MKLFTEEQVKSAFRIGLRENYIDEQDAENYANKGIKYLTPIELPSDEEIEGYALEFGRTEIQMVAFEEGAKFVKQFIEKKHIL